MSDPAGGTGIHIAGVRDIPTVSLSDYTMDPQVLRVQVQEFLHAHLVDLPSYIEDYPELQEVIRFDPATGLPSLKKTELTDIYLDTLEQLMLILTEWAGRLMEIGRDFQDAASVCAARASAAQYSAYHLAGTGSKRSIKDRELLAKQDPKYRSAEFEEQVYTSMARRLEDAASRMGRTVDALKYSHRRILKQEGAQRVHQP